MKPLRTFGIALGSLTAAWLCLWLVGRSLLGPSGGGVIAAVAVVVLGGLVFADILRRES